MSFSRYAIYFVPAPSEDWAGFCTSWLGWNLVTGRTCDHPDIAGLPAPIARISQAPRKYGLHATLKPPFRLADGTTEANLRTACGTLASGLGPVQDPGLKIAQMGRFLALTGTGPGTDLSHLAERCVRDLDRFRAPLTQAEMNHRKSAGRLSLRQEQLLSEWGYPHVMEAFRFHITLTGRLPSDHTQAVKAILEVALDSDLPAPFVIHDIALVGETRDGNFHLIERFPLAG